MLDIPLAAGDAFFLTISSLCSFCISGISFLMLIMFLPLRLSLSLWVFFVLIIRCSSHHPLKTVQSNYIIYVLISMFFFFFIICLPIKTANRMLVFNKIMDVGSRKHAPAKIPKYMFYGTEEIPFTLIFVSQELKEKNSFILNYILNWHRHKK